LTSSLVPAAPTVWQALDQRRPNLQAMSYGHLVGIHPAANTLVLGGADRSGLRITDEAADAARAVRESFGAEPGVKVRTT
jgi:hypothetical protein